MAQEPQESPITTPEAQLQPQGEAQKPRIVVIGSINMDLVVRTRTIPQPGETVSGHSFSTIPGGKGANQAVAAARAGGNVAMIGRVGNDDFGQRLLCNLQGNGVDVSAIMVTEGVSTGVAMISVDDQGENAICVAPGANAKVCPTDVADQMELLGRADAIIMQMEIPQETVVYTIRQAHRLGKPVILNPAPAPLEPDSALYESDVLIPNQNESSRLCGEAVTDITTAKLAGAALINRGIKNVVITLGRRGAVAITTAGTYECSPFNVKVVDTTGAGDAFCGAFAVHFARTGDLGHALRYAVAAGALACTRFGAQPSMPHEEAILTLLHQQA